MSPRRKGRNVYPLPGGRWLARLWRGGELHKAAFATRLEAEQYRDAVDLDWRLRTRGLPGIVHQRPLLLDLVARFLAAAERRGLAPATLAYYRYTLAGWRERIALAAHGAGVPYREEGAVEVGVSFRFPRPKSHYRGNGPDGKPILRESCAERPHVSRPDLDKLVRAVLDGLTGIAYRDDSQVTVLAASKLYAPEFGEPGVWIRVSSGSGPQGHTTA